MQKILSIHFPMAYIEREDPVHVGELPSTARQGDYVEKDEEGNWQMAQSNTNPDCVGNVCPIK